MRVVPLRTDQVSDVTLPSETHLRDEPPVATQLGTLVDHTELAIIAIERTRMPMVVTDPQQPDNPIVFANRAFLNDTGYPADEVIGHNCRFLQGPDTDPETVNRVREAIAAKKEITVEMLNYRRDGTTFWNQLFITPITEDTGKLIYFFASQLDISEERRARDLSTRENILLREIDHRAKNALAMVQGIVRLSRADDPRDYSRSVQGRVDALAQAHAILSDHEWRDVPLGRIVTAATAPFGAARTSSDGPALDIAIAQVQPLVLLFHELLTNAVQHGGLSAEAGTVALKWRTEGDNVIIELSETGGPPPPDDRKSGYGMKMVDAFVGRQLRGTVERGWHRRGLTTRVSFPANGAMPKAAAGAY